MLSQKSLFGPNDGHPCVRDHYAEQRNAGILSAITQAVRSVFDDGYITAERIVRDAFDVSVQFTVQTSMPPFSFTRQLTVAEHPSPYSIASGVPNIPQYFGIEEIENRIGELIEELRVLKDDRVMA